MHNSLAFRSRNLQFLLMALLFIVQLGQSFQQSPTITTLQELRHDQGKSASQSMQAVARGLILKMEGISGQGKFSMALFSTQFHRHIKTAIHGLKGVAQVITPGVSEELDHSIPDAIAILDKTASALGQSIDKGIASMSLMTSEAFRISRAAARDVKEAVEKAVAQGKLHKDIEDQLMKISNEHVNSITRRLQEFEKSIRQIADGIVVISSQYQTRSSDLKGVPKPVKRELVQAGRDLSSNWDAVIRITELTGGGNASAEKVDKALNNIRYLNLILLEEEREVDDETTKTLVPNMGSRGRVNLSVFVITVAISLKGCHKWVS